MMHRRLADDAAAADTKESTYTIAPGHCVELGDAVSTVKNLSLPSKTEGCDGTCVIHNVEEVYKGSGTAGDQCFTVDLYYNEYPGACTNAAGDPALEFPITSKPEETDIATEAACKEACLSSTDVCHAY
jgi:hypothetical protein